jgi:hypothetical protein
VRLFQALRRPSQADRVALVEPVPQYLRDHAAHLKLSPFAVAATTLRLRLPDGLTLLALMASRGRLGLEGLVVEMRDLLDRDADPAPGTIDVTALAALSRASAGWPGPDGDMPVTADLFRALRLVRRSQPLKPADIVRKQLDRLEVQSNLTMGRTDHVRSIEPDLLDDGDLRWMVATELAHPQHGLDGSTWDGWLRSFNQIFERDGLAPVTLAGGETAPFDRLASAAPPVPAGSSGPLVTVVMATYSPDQSLLTALRSIVEQTWADLEILLVDDCSPDTYLPLLEQAAALDDRIVLHRMPVNGGPYRIRNFAMGQARGEFIAFQDGDDWSHPERIERQLRPLLDDPHLVASLSRSIRATSSLSLNKVGFAATRRNMSSLVFRREDVLAVLGGFDDVRKSGDSEFVKRMRTVFGEDRIHPIEVTMAVVQLTEGSLSRSDYLFGWVAPDRAAYRDSAEYWHSLVGAGTESPRVSSGARRFPAPASIAGTVVQPVRATAAIVSDLRLGIGRYQGVADEVGALIDAGVSVVALHAETMRFARVGRVPPDRVIMGLRHSGRLAGAQWDAPTEVDLVLVRDPELLSYPRTTDHTQVRTGRVVVHAPIPPRSPDGWLVYDPSVVEENARALFGASPEWLPATAGIAEAIAAEGVAGELLAPAQLGVVEVAGPARGPWSARPVVGTAALDRLRRDRLTAAELLDLLPQDPRLDIRVRDDEKVLDAPTAPDPVPDAWQRHDEMPLDAFLSSLDVYVCWSRRSVAEERPYLALSAMAHGCIVVAPRELSEHFGSAAVYLDGRPLVQVVLDLAADPVDVESQRQRGYDYLMTSASSAEYVSRVRRLASDASR